MTIADFVGILGAIAGIAVLALMAAVPLLLALPLPDKSTHAQPQKSTARTAPVDAVAPAPAAAPPVAVPAQRTAPVRRVTTPHLGSQGSHAAAS